MQTPSGDVLVEDLGPTSLLQGKGGEGPAQPSQGFYISASRGEGSGSLPVEPHTASLRPAEGPVAGPCTSLVHLSLLVTQPPSPLESATGTELVPQGLWGEP